PTLGEAGKLFVFFPGYTFGNEENRFAEAADAALFRIPAVRFVGAFLQLYSPSAPSRFHAEWPQGRSFKVFTASRNGIKNY
ncbi:MAG: hypothetical protein ACFN2Z_02095, partial [Oribacterium sp.]